MLLWVTLILSFLKFMQAFNFRCISNYACLCNFWGSDYLYIFPFICTNWLFFFYFDFISNRWLFLLNTAGTGHKENSGKNCVEASTQTAEKSCKLIYFNIEIVSKAIERTWFKTNSALSNTHSKLKLLQFF